MLTLSIDTSTPLGTVALGNDKVIVREIEFQGPQRHSSTLFPALMQIGLPRLQLNRIIVGLGPGSFSGIRVALAAAQAIALVQSVPLVGICSAHSIGLQFRRIARLGVFADARRGEYYGTFFTRGKLESGPLLFPDSEIDKYLRKVTLGVTSEDHPLIAERAYPRASDYFSFPPDFDGWVEGAHLEPIYLREPLEAKK